MGCGIMKKRESITAISLSAIPTLPILKTLIFPFQIYNTMTIILQY